jgi:hypothetical protein
MCGSKQPNYWSSQQYKYHVLVLAFGPLFSGVSIQTHVESPLGSARVGPFSPWCLGNYWSSQQYKYHVLVLAFGPLFLGVSIQTHVESPLGSARVGPFSPWCLGNYWNKSSTPTRSKCNQSRPLFVREPFHCGALRILHIKVIPRQQLPVSWSFVGILTSVYQMSPLWPTRGR